MNKRIASILIAMVAVLGITVWAYGATPCSPSFHGSTNYPTSLDTYVTGDCIPAAVINNIESFLGTGSGIVQNLFLKVANNLSDVNNSSTALSNLGGMKASNNLSELTNTSTARANLGLGDSSLLPSSTFLKTANNFSDVLNTSTARTNLGLGDSSLLASSTWFKVANNLSESTNTSTLRTNIGYTGGNKVSISSTGTVFLTSSNVSQFTNDSGYVTSTTGLTLGGTPTITNCGTSTIASSVTFSYTGTVASFTLPTTFTGTTTTITIAGASGASSTGSNGGFGQQVVGTVSGTIGQVFYYYLGARGIFSSSTNGSANTCQGGGGAGDGTGGGASGQGGQCSWISPTSTPATSTVLLVAGGGGGDGRTGDTTAGRGGSANIPNASSGVNGTQEPAGGGGTQTAGGFAGQPGVSATGTAFRGADGNVATPGGGGGGGGFFGGGSGGSDNGAGGAGQAGGGGGGSSFTSSTISQITTSTNVGTGTVQFSYFTSFPSFVSGRDFAGSLIPNFPVTACTATYSLAHSTFSSCTLTPQKVSSTVWVTNQTTSSFTANSTIAFSSSSPLNYVCPGD